VAQSRCRDTAAEGRDDDPGRGLGLGWSANTLALRALERRVSGPEAATSRPRSLTPHQEQQVFRWINGEKVILSPYCTRAGDELVRRQSTIDRALIRALLRYVRRLEREVAEGAPGDPRPPWRLSRGAGHAAG
jgi:hypothetical protein